LEHCGALTCSQGRFSRCLSSYFTLYVGRGRPRPIWLKC
jgi:hypothetical protein